MKVQFWPKSTILVGGRTEKLGIEPAQPNWGLDLGWAWQQWNQQCSYISESKSESNILKSKKIKSFCDLWFNHILPSSAKLANQGRQFCWLVLLPQSPLPDRPPGSQAARQPARPEKYFLAKIELGHQIQSCFPQWVNIKNVFKP